jgi:hypothetical protein
MQVGWDEKAAAVSTPTRSLKNFLVILSEAKDLLSYAQVTALPPLRSR